MVAGIIGWLKEFGHPGVGEGGSDKRILVGDGAWGHVKHGHHREICTVLRDIRCAKLIDFGQHIRLDFGGRLVCSLGSHIYVDHGVAIRRPGWLPLFDRIFTHTRYWFWHKSYDPADPPEHISLLRSALDLDGKRTLKAPK